MSTFPKNDSSLETILLLSVIYRNIFYLKENFSITSHKIAQVLLILGGWKYGDKVEKRPFFPKAPPISQIFLWVVGHFINVISCILYLTNFSRKLGRALETNSTLLIIFAKLTLKFVLSLPVLAKFYNFYSLIFPNIYTILQNKRMRRCGVSPYQ